MALGEQAWQLTLTPGETGGLICLGRDVTAEATAREARETSEIAAAAARRDQDRLLTSLGHDFRTPMTTIMGTCELLLDGALEAEQRTWLERMHGSCGALLGMLNGLLEVAGDEVGRGTQLREPVEVTALVQEVADVLRPQARDKGLELRIRCDDLLRGQWLLDPGRLRQVVFNLASNAVKFTGSGRVEIRASAIDADGQSRLRIAVSDTGPGIDPGEREQIFERFRRGRAQEASGAGGLGLGLALCRDNAALMGGSISLESALGVGSEFTFECPAERVPEQDRHLPFAGRTALIVADDIPAIRALAGQLGELGLMVETAPDGYLGLALAERLEAQRGAVDLVVLQSSLPGMAGEVFVRRLRSTPFGRRAVLLWVGNGADEVAVDATLPAPPDPYQVATVARQLLAERPSLDALEPNARVTRGGRVLLVEDDKANQALLAAALSRRGFAVFTAGNGEEAVRMAGRNTFDAILMDLQMPGLDGFEATRRIRALPGQAAGVPIAALTALQGMRLRQRCTEAGFSAVLEKPVNMERLTNCLHRWMGDSVSAAPPERGDHGLCRRCVGGVPGGDGGRGGAGACPGLRHRVHRRRLQPLPPAGRAAAGLGGRSDPSQLRGDQRHGRDLRRAGSGRAAGGDRRCGQPRRPCDGRGDGRAPGHRGRPPAACHGRVPRRRLPSLVARQQGRVVFLLLQAGRRREARPGAG